MGNSTAWWSLPLLKSCFTDPLHQFTSCEGKLLLNVLETKNKQPGMKKTHTHPFPNQKKKKLQGLLHSAVY